ACDGAGACVVGPSVACPSRDCAGPMCASPCTSDADCARPTWCDTATGACTPDLPNGDPCGRAGMCLSDLCIDGVCCGELCTGTCRSCTVPGSEGECAFIPVGTDPDDECPGVLACDVDGKCESFDAGRVSLDASVPARDAAYVEPADASRPDAGPVDSTRDAGRFDPDALFLQFDASGPPPDSGPIDASLMPPARTAGACVCRAGGASRRPMAALTLLALGLLLLYRRR
ncbi:MAG: hypothetical protein J0L92_11895, partial [Deltaproteobacteria bacterium]|nr:hypothetical protein [Deltaproteobacteria bacterium]